jgi:predicted CopG family antitoxin
MTKTTIQITTELLEKLKKLRVVPREDYDSVITRLVNKEGILKKCSFDLDVIRNVIREELELAKRGY